MIRPRVIPILLLDDRRLVKTTRFKEPRYVGDPLNVIRIFNEKEVDELIVLDITATFEGREPNFDFIETLASECFMPLTYGGAVRHVEAAKRLFASGVEKVCIKPWIEQDKSILTEIAKQFGSQALVASVDVLRTSNGWNLYPTGKSKQLFSEKWLNHLRSCVDAGAGEILLTAVEREGSRNGLDLELVELAASNCDVPLIVNGGVGSAKDIQDGLAAGADAVAGGSFFVFHGMQKAVLISYPNVDAI